MLHTTRLFVAHLPETMATKNCVAVDPKVTDQTHVRIGNCTFPVDLVPMKEPNLIKLSAYQRESLGLEEGKMIEVSFCLVPLIAKIHTSKKPGETTRLVVVITLDDAVPKGVSAKGSFDSDRLAEHARKALNYHFPSLKMPLCFAGDRFVFKGTITSVEKVTLNESLDVVEREPYHGIFSLKDVPTNILFNTSAKAKFVLTGAAVSATTRMAMELPSFAWNDIGIGGLGGELAAIVRRAFSTRLIPAIIAKQMGIAPVRGIILHGPSGTGKTLMARKISAMFTQREPKIVNGPELLNKFVGQSEENLRSLFKDAERDQSTLGPSSPLHVIVFDECDALFRRRSVGDGTGSRTTDGLVNQLLAKMDGVERLDNILLIAMTNRIELLDEALLRPGRFEVNIRVGLPDEAGRREIFDIHTSHLREGNRIANDVDLNDLAARTKNFTGAEIEGLVKSAVSFAVNRHIDLPTEVGEAPKLKSVERMIVTREDFEGALREVRPAFGGASEELERLAPPPFVEHSGIQHPLNVIRATIEELKNSAHKRNQLLLIAGPPGSGKSALAAHAAKLSGAPFVRVIDAMKLLANTNPVSVLTETFRAAHQSESAIIILDALENIIEYNPLAMHVSSSLLHAVRTLMRSTPPKGCKTLVIVTARTRAKHPGDDRVAKAGSRDEGFYTAHFGVLVDIAKSEYVGVSTAPCVDGEDGEGFLPPAILTELSTGLGIKCTGTPSPEKDAPPLRASIRRAVDVINGVLAEKGEDATLVDVYNALAA